MTDDKRTSDARAIAEAVASKCNTCGATRHYIGKRRWRCPTYDCPGIVDWLADPPAPRSNDAKLVTCLDCGHKQDFGKSTSCCKCLGVRLMPSDEYFERSPDARAFVEGMTGRAATRPWVCGAVHPGSGEKCTSESYESEARAKNNHELHVGDRHDWTNADYDVHLDCVDRRCPSCKASAPRVDKVQAKAPERDESKERTLECDHCGDAAITSPNGFFWDGDGGRCVSCGYPGHVSCDGEEDPWWNTGQEETDFCARHDCDECNERRLESLGNEAVESLGIDVPQEAAKIRERVRRVLPLVPAPPITFDDEPHSDYPQITVERLRSVVEERGGFSLTRPEAEAIIADLCTANPEGK